MTLLTNGTHELVAMTWELWHMICLVFKCLSRENTAARQQQHGQQNRRRLKAIEANDLAS